MMVEIEYYTVSLDEIWDKLVTTNDRQWVRALWSVSAMAARFPSVAKTIAGRPIHCRVSLESVASAFDNLVGFGLVDHWSTSKSGDAYILSPLGAERAGLRLHATSTRWYSRKSKGLWDNAKALRSLAEQESHQANDPANHRDTSSPDPSRIDWDSKTRPHVLLGERLQWNGPAWQRSMEPCPGCHAERRILLRLRTAREHGAASDRACAAEREIGARYCLVCDSFVRDRPSKAKHRVSGPFRLATKQADLPQQDKQGGRGLV